jgi:hypothetical protein
MINNEEGFSSPDIISYPLCDGARLNPEEFFVPL